MQISASAQAKAQETLLSVSQDPDWSICYAAVVGLQALSTMPDLKGQIQAQFEQMARTDPDTAVRARVSLAQQLFHIKNRSIRCQYHYLKLHQPLRTSASKVTKYPTRMSLEFTE